MTTSDHSEEFPSAAPDTDRRSRGEITRERIVRTATDLFTAHGYTGVSLRELARAADMSVPGITRHYRTKEEVLMQVLDAVDPATADAPDSAPWATRHHLLLRIGGEATSREHPAHDRIRRNYADDIATLTASFDRDPRFREDPGSHARAVVACRDGLSLLGRYGVFDTDPDALVRSQLLGLAEDSGPRPAAEPHPPVDALLASAPAADYGDRRRATIARRAMNLFATQGYTATSMSGIADAVGTSKASLFHHFGDKLGLLMAVLAQRDVASAATVAHPVGTPAEQLLRMASGAKSTGLVQLYTVLASEAATPGHPAHEYFRGRFLRAVAFFGRLFDAARADGTLLPAKDPSDQAVLTVALWEGLQIQSLHLPEQHPLLPVVESYVQWTFAPR